MVEEKQYTQLNIVIPVEMKQWLDTHKEINRSDLFRQAVNQKMMLKKQKVSPLFFFATVMGVMFGVVLILIGISPTPLNIYLKAILSLAGGFMASLSGLLYLKELKNLKENLFNV